MCGIGQKGQIMKAKVNFPKNIYIVLLLVMILGVFIQISRSQFVLKFHQNRDFFHQKEELLMEISPEKTIYNSGNNYCVVYSASDEYSSRLKANAAKSLEYMKKKSTEINLDSEKLTPDNCDVIIVAMDKLNKLGTPKELDNFVLNGGYMMFMAALNKDSNYNVLYRKFGVSAFGEHRITQGIDLVSNVLIGEKDLQMKGDFIENTTLLVELDNDSKLLAKSFDGVPLLWERQYGEGAFMTFNGTMLQEKLSRGLFAGALSLLEPNFIYPIFNSKVFFIDDLPAPIAEGEIPVIFDEYKRDTPSFYQEIWWPNMLTVAKKYDIKYTGAIIESYNDNVNPPFENPVDADRFTLITYGREMIKSGGEIGIHGYNHQSLLTDRYVSKDFGYNVWKNEKDMTASIKEVLKYTKESFPEYTVTSYVPPSNLLSNEGREALKSAWPELTVISSLYGEDGSGMAYVQEFEIAPDKIIEMPRVTSGYNEEDYDRWAEANAMTGLGVYSSFVHPDDVISNDRGHNRTWGQLYQGFEENMSRVKKTYPWVRSMTATEAALNMAMVLNANIKWTYTENSIKGEIANYQSESYYILRTDRKIRKMSNCTVNKIDTDTFLVVAHDSKFNIELGGDIR